MPVRSTSTSVFRWPDLETVRDAAAEWARAAAAARDDVVRIGIWGSCARGDWGVGSDLDLVVVVEHSATPWERRAADWDTTTLPVPTDLLVYTADEWNALDRTQRFGRTLAAEVRWLIASGVESRDC